MFLERLNEEHGTMKTFTPEACQSIAAYRWPGNVRELKNVIHRAYVLSDAEVNVDTGAEFVAPIAAATSPPRADVSTGNEVRIQVGTSLDVAERALIMATLRGARRQQVESGARAGYQPQDALQPTARLRRRRLRDARRRAARSRQAREPRSGSRLEEGCRRSFVQSRGRARMLTTDPLLSASRQEPPLETVASTRKKRILVVDDHALVRAGFRQLIDRTDDLEVGGEAGTAAAALDLAVAEEFDVVMLDISLPDASVVETVAIAPAPAARAPYSDRQHARRGAIRRESAARRSERVLSQGRRGEGHA